MFILALSLDYWVNLILSEILSCIRFNQSLEVETLCNPFFFNINIFLCSKQYIQGHFVYHQLRYCLDISRIIRLVFCAFYFFRIHLLENGMLIPHWGLPNYEELMKFLFLFSLLSIFIAKKESREHFIFEMILMKTLFRKWYFSNREHI